MLQQYQKVTSNPPYRVEDRWIKEWFRAVIHNYECYGITELSEFRNYEINYEFEQPKEHKNRIVFQDGVRHVTLIAQKISVEYISLKGVLSNYPTIRIIRKNKNRKPIFIHG